MEKSLILFMDDLFKIILFFIGLIVIVASGIGFELWRYDIFQETTHSDMSFFWMASSVW